MPRRMLLELGKLALRILLSVGLTCAFAAAFYAWGGGWRGLLAVFSALTLTEVIFAFVPPLVRYVREHAEDWIVRAIVWILRKAIGADR